MNAYSERFVRSTKDERLDRMILVGQTSLCRAIREYVEHYHRERNYQELYPPAPVPADSGAIGCHARLGGMLNFYYRKAA